MKRSIMFVILGALMIILLCSGCGSKTVIGDTSKVGKIGEGQGRVITFWHTYSDEETRLLEQILIPSYERQHPGIRINAVRQYNNIELKYTLISRASSNRTPDIVRMDIAWVPEFSQNGLLMPLDSFSDFEQIRQHFEQDYMKIGYSEGHYYSLPLNINTKVAIFNRKLLEQAGYETPPSSLKEVIDIAKQHYYTIGISGLESWKILPYIYALGGVMTDDQYTQAIGYFNSERTVSAVQELVNLYKAGVIDSSIINGGADNWGGVKNGKVFMTDEGPWFYSVFKGAELNKALRSTIAVPFPYTEGPASIMGGEDLVMLKGTKNGQEAWNFIKWMTGKEAQTIMSQTGLIPTHQEAKALKVQNDSFIYPYVQALDHLFLRPPVKNWSKIDDIFSAYMLQIFQGKIGVQEGLDQAASQIDVLLESKR